MVTEHEERRKDEEVMVIEGKMGAMLVGSWVESFSHQHQLLGYLELSLVLFPPVCFYGSSQIFC